jgi:hypothetical protein
MKQYACALALTAVCAAVNLPAAAHVVAGARVFPVTLTFDDPGVGDEATLPQFVYPPTPKDQTEYQLQWEYDKTITPDTALIYNQGWNVLEHAAGEATKTGFQNVFLTGKWQAYTNGPHELVVSLGVIREFSGNQATVNVGGDAYGSTAPTIYAGKGLGDLPIGLLRPLAVTGELSYIIPDRRLNSTADNSGNPYSWSGAFSVQYSIPYLQSQVRSFGLPSFVAHLIPLVETDWYSPAAGPATGFPSTLIVAPGFIYLGETMQWGIEALIPANRAAGTHVGVIAQLHFFFDDLFPNTIGRPILP